MAPSLFKLNRTLFTKQLPVALWLFLPLFASLLVSLSFSGTGARFAQYIITLSYLPIASYVYLANARIASSYLTQEPQITTTVKRIHVLSFIAVCALTVAFIASGTLVLVVPGLLFFHQFGLAPAYASRGIKNPFKALSWSAAHTKHNWKTVTLPHIAGIIAHLFGYIVLVIVILGIQTGFAVKSPTDILQVPMSLYAEIGIRCVDILIFMSFINMQMRLIDKLRKQAG